MMNGIRMLIHDERDIDTLNNVLYKTPEKIGIQIHSNNNTVFIMNELTYQHEMSIAVVSREVFKPEHVIESLKLYVVGYYAGVRMGEEKLKKEFKRLFDLME